MQTYEPPCDRSMNITISTVRTEQILDKIERNDFKGISLEEYLQVSFLTLMSGEEQHLEEKVVYGGNVFELHACVQQVNPNHAVSVLRKIV